MCIVTFDFYQEALQYHQKETKMWDIARDEVGSLDDSGFLEVVDLSLNEPLLQVDFSQCGVTRI